MWIFLVLMWRIVGKVLRRVGWGGLLIPVAAMGMALAGVHFWTVALVLIALAVVLRKPLLAAALLPLSMISAGLAGLVVAAMTPGGSMNYFVRAVMAKPQVAWEVLPQAVAGYIPAKGGPVTYVLPKATVVWTKGTAARHQVLAQVPWVRDWAVRPVAGSKPLAVSYAIDKGPEPGAQAWSVAGVGRSVGGWQGHLLVPVALLLLTIGLWLAPRMLRGVRPLAASRMPELRRWLAANRWALLLPPVVGVGMAAFGAQPWTIAAVVAALVIIVIRWPVITADMVPFALAALAVIGYLIAARWQSASPGFYQHPMLYGPVWVDGPKSAIAAGAEASAFLALGAWLVPRTIGARWRSTPDADLAGRVARLTESRGHAVDAAAAELRRIERDLHDGAQARLVALGMNLRAVERVLPSSPQAALALVAEARETSVRALNELRDLIRGICPPVLADRGLGHAVQALVLDTPLPTALEIDLPGRLTAPVESACYFAIAEALANAVKHSGARHAGIRIQHASGLLRIEVADDGVGGADPQQGTGLQGVERRLGTFDGIMAVSSPPGGPTMVVMEVPCALLSPKTCSC